MLGGIGILYILYYIILYYVILYYSILYYTILYYIILYYIIIYYTMLYYTILYYIVLFCIKKFCTIIYIYTYIYIPATQSRTPDVSAFRVSSPSCQAACHHSPSRAGGFQAMQCPESKNSEVEPKSPESKNSEVGPRNQKLCKSYLSSSPTA